jgi:ATP-binding cassette subfamily C protein
MPRVFIDLIIFFSFSIIIISIIDDKKELQNILPTLSIFAIASMRIMPSFNRVISNIQSVKFNIKVVDIIYEYLKTNDNKYIIDYSNNFDFNNKLEFKNICFRYNELENYVIDNVNFSIEKGKIIGITGESGSGKSTIVDMICGLNKPNSGSILLDNIKVDLNNNIWRNKIGYVTQDYYIADGLLINNVAFGIEDSKINYSLAIKSLADSMFPLESYNPIDKFYLIEHGKNLSGGQRQRIAIARALYKNSEILILDEATSALDKETEKLFFNDLLKLKGSKTIIIITHNINLLDYCDKIYHLKNNKINITKDYE